MSETKKDKRIGQKRHMLTAIRLSHIETKYYNVKRSNKPEKRNLRYYICKCDCGNEVVISQSKFGTTMSCGCAKQKNRKGPYIIKNQKYGRLLAIEPSEVRVHNHKAWVFKCDCGKIVRKSIYSVSGGNTTSCGCYRTEMSKLPRKPNDIKENKRSKPRKPRVDLTDKTFGKLTALKENGRSNNGSILWSCQCECGKTTNVTASNLTLGKTKSCGCLRRKPIVDLTDKTFGKLTALKENGRSKTRSVLWLCRCECGTEKTIDSSNLIQGLTKSCGCGKYKDNVGVRYGLLKGIKPVGQNKAGNIMWLCQCDCGGSIVVSTSSLTSGNNRSCGCLAGRPKFEKEYYEHI